MISRQRFRRSLFHRFIQSSAASPAAQKVEPTGRLHGGHDVIDATDEAQQAIIDLSQSEDAISSGAGGSLLRLP